MFVKVAFPIPKDQTFDYAVPAALTGGAAVGKRVLAPFGNKNHSGYVIDISTATEIESPKDIIEIIDPQPLFNASDLAFYRWTADYYLYPLGKVLQEILPGGKLCRAKTEQVVRVRNDHIFATALTPKQQLILKIIREAGEVSVADLSRSLGGNARPTLTSLVKKGLVELTDSEVFRAMPSRLEIGQKSGRPLANTWQEGALQEICRGLHARRYAAFLLHGVTGSGKTEVYIRAMEETRRQGGGVILLVPEIALTPQLLTRLSERFGNDGIAVLHSGVSRSVRYDQWRLLQAGKLCMAVGARSAIFAPVRNLRLIIVDEEHDASYKQDERLPYNARDMAVVKGRMEGATVVLGSATPAVQTYFNVRKGKYSLLTLPRRIADRPLPVIEIVDMKVENSRQGRGSPAIISRDLLAALRETLDRKQQALLLLNRRGYHTILICRDCGHPLKCRNCDVSLIHHAGEKLWKCHYCNYSVSGPSICSRCKSPRIGVYGVGTERLEEEVNKHFPDARTRRMDSDTMERRGAHAQLLHALGAEQIDILVGTQMISKGHDFPNVTLVGVILADTSLNLPDFRAAERTFQILTQVSGRGGRGNHPGRVIIQTFNPDHYALQKAKDHDYEGFYKEERELRKSAAFPPYSRLIQINISSSQQARGEEGVGRLVETARRLLAQAGGKEKVEIVGPAEAPLFRLRGRYRWQLLLKSEDSRFLRALTRELLSRVHMTGVQIRADVDPVHFL